MNPATTEGKIKAALKQDSKVIKNVMQKMDDAQRELKSAITVTARTSAKEKSEPCKWAIENPERGPNSPDKCKASSRVGHAGTTRVIRTPENATGLQQSQGKVSTPPCMREITSSQVQSGGCESTSECVCSSMEGWRRGNV